MSTLAAASRADVEKMVRAILERQLAPRHRLLRTRPSMAAKRTGRTWSPTSRRGIVTSPRMM